MEQVNEAQPQSQPPSQRFYALEQLGELAGTITLISEGLQAYRAQVAGLLAGQKKAEAFELYRLLERQRTYLVEQIRATRPFLMELENPLAPAAQKLAEQLAAFPLMTADYSKLTEVLKRFADALPDHQTTDASIIGRLMNNVRLGHYPTDLTHVGYIANSIVFPAENTANLIDPCCGTGDALLRLALGTDSQCYGIELDDHRAEQAQQQLYRVGFGSFFGSNISPGAFHAVFLNPPYLSVLSENGGRSRDEKRFLIESIPLLMMGGLLIYIVPYYRLTADLCGIICDNFEQVRIHRFLDREFKQFKQVVVTGVRRRRTEAEQDAEALCSAAEHPETLPTRDLLVELEFEDESGKLRTLARHRKDDKMDITLDGVRIGQGDLTTMFGERDLFLSMFNPQYFINVLGSKGRNLLERYLPEVPKAEVLAQLSDQTRALLEKQEFLSAEAYSKQLREQVTDIEKDMVYIQGQIDLHASQQKEQAQELMEAQVRHTQLQERIGELERKRTTGFDGNSMIDRLADLYARYEELQRENPVIADTANLDLQIHAAAEKLARRKADAYQSKYAAALAQAQERIHRLSMEFKRTKHIHDGLTAGVQCPMCRQTITEQTLPQVKGEFAASLRRIQAEGCQLTAQCKEVQELDAKARTVFEQFREDDIAAGEAELEELSGQRKQALEQAEERRNFHQQELERLHSEIQSTELDRECGMLSQEEIEELNRARTEFAGLNAKIEVLSKLVQASPEAAGKQEQDIKQMQASIQQKKELLSALAFYISKRVEINFSKLRMNRVSITLYDVVKSTGEVKDVFRFTYEGRDYICLSHSERIRAGLEVAELIKRLLGVEYPTFIDDVESVPVIDNVRPTGQVFIAKVIKGTALQVQVADNTGVPKAA